MQRVLCGVVLLAAVVLARAAGAVDLNAAVGVLDARIAALSPASTASARREARLLTLARRDLLACTGSAAASDVRHLTDVVVTLVKAASPAPEVRALLDVVRESLDTLAAEARQAASERLGLLSQEANRQRVAAIITTGDDIAAAAAAAWPVSASRAARLQARAIAAYQRALTTAQRLFARESPADPVRYAGPPPASGLVSFPHAGELVAVEAFPGQVLVLFDPPLPAAAARASAMGLGGMVLSQIPEVGCYLVQVPSGQEGTFIEQICGEPGVYLAFPHLAGHYASTDVTVIDDCAGSHGEEVQRVLTDHGVAVGNCRTDGYGSRPVPIWTLWEMEREAIERRTGPTLINISSSQGLTGGAYWDDQPEDVQRRVLTSYAYDLKALLKTISQLPLPSRENLVVTLCAGNNHIPLDGVLAEIGADPALLAVLQRHVLIVGSKGQFFSNYATVFQDDFAWVNNPESTRGTSFAAPYALALIARIRDRHGVSATEALRLVKEAVADNPDHELLESEVLPVDPGDTYAGAVAGSTTDTLDGNVWAAVVALDLLVTVSGSGLIGDPYDVSLEFTGTLTETLRTCADPGGCDPGGTYPVSGMGQQTALGRVSATALLNGSENGFTVRLTDGVLNADRTRLTGTVTVGSVAFDAPVSRSVTFILVP